MGNEGHLKQFKTAANVEKAVPKEAPDDTPAVGTWEEAIPSIESGRTQYVKSCVNREKKLNELSGSHPKETKSKVLSHCDRDIANGNVVRSRVIGEVQDEGSGEMHRKLKGQTGTVKQYKKTSINEEESGCRGRPLLNEQGPAGPKGTAKDRGACAKRPYQDTGDAGCQSSPNDITNRKSAAGRAQPSKDGHPKGPDDAAIRNGRRPPPIGASTQSTSTVS